MRRNIMDLMLLLGDEAIAQGAMDAGMSGVYAYPGTPSTEITEYIQRSKQAKEKKVHSEWSVNEKTAMEEALGMSYAGKRAMVCMKHVGLNVAADAFVNSAITGANGGLLVVVADDPSMHSSQNEQDSRYYGKFAMIPVLEPSDQQEAYDMAYKGFELSERYDTPVLLRITTRLAHSRGAVYRKDLLEENILKLPENMTQYVLLPAIARIQYKKLIDKQQEINTSSEGSEYNYFFDAPDKQRGIIACGITINYLRELYDHGEVPYPVLKIGQYPAPVDKVKMMIGSCAEVLLLEEGYPFLEEMLNTPYMPQAKIKGRLSGDLPRTGELNPDLIAKALGMEPSPTRAPSMLVKGRPPSMCAGCTHIEVYNELNAALKQYGKGRVFSDIGCYTLGALPPYNAINSCVDMGASITMAKGAADAGLKPAVAVIGDSTFTHSGMTGLMDAIYENSPITIIISDNRTTAMTGGQTSLATGKLDEVCIGLGVDPDHVHTFEPSPKNRQEVINIIEKELAYEGLSVIIPVRECVQTAKKHKKQNTKKEVAS